MGGAPTGINIPAPPPLGKKAGETGTSPERAKAILDYLSRFEGRARNGRHDVLRNCYENVLFYIGHQWLTYDISARTFRRANLRKDVPRPVTNRYKAILDSVDAVLTQLEPSLTVAPGSDKDVDRLAADLGKMVITYLEKVTRFEEKRRDLSKTVVTCNNAYVHTFINPEGGYMKSVARWECPQCQGAEPMDAIAANDAQGQCPQCGTGLTRSAGPGDTVGEGQIDCEVLTPFEVWVDYSIRQMREQPAVLIRQMRPVHWVKDLYADVDEKIAKLSPETSTSSWGDVGLTYLQAIIRLTPGAFTGFGSGMKYEQSTLVDTLYVRPCTEFPEGLCARIINKEIVVEDHALGDIAHDGTTEQPGRPFIPIAHYGYDNVPCTHLHTGPADQLKELQKHRNRLESSIVLFFARMANGIWLIPEGSDVQTPTGEEGWVMRYSPVAIGTTALRPERMDGGRLPNTFVEWIKFLDDRMEDIAGTYDIMRGERPPNVTSGYGMSILQARSQSRHASLFRNYEDAYADTARHWFFLFRNHAPEEIYFRIKGEESRWTVQMIQSADLNGGIDIDVEAGSSRPKSLLEKRAAAEQALSMGLLDLTDPTVRLKFMNLLGIPEFMEPLKADDEHVAREHATLMAWAKTVAVPDPQTGQMVLNPEMVQNPESVQMPVHVDPLLDNHPLHIARHRPWMLSDEYRGLPDFVQQQFRDGHYAEHVMIEQMNQANAAQAQGGSPPPGGGGKPPGQQPQGQAKGDKQGDANAVASQSGGGAQGREERRAQSVNAAAQPGGGR